MASVVLSRMLLRHVLLLAFHGWREKTGASRDQFRRFCVVRERCNLGTQRRHLAAWMEECDRRAVIRAVLSAAAARRARRETARVWFAWADVAESERVRFDRVERWFTYRRRMLAHRTTEAWCALAASKRALRSLCRRALSRKSRQLAAYALAT
eukprot:CAMPEP_0170165458 /NCGR_PEP_ID=MMETSP0033_2-20121228/78617_1 /TAXON_ID=195969 /ORGANISM="Dolichomastix tenuilepis, Strain CCMP3274" /LENGTH=153 /DNA_ID=CAMNT_0010403107 /DNA_START=639 /DNA_END=1096 /DNA_ORIENTATION=-